MTYTPRHNGGKTKCKYYRACGNRENCDRCESFEKATRQTLKKFVPGTQEAIDEEEDINEYLEAQDYMEVEEI